MRDPESGNGRSRTDGSAQALADLAAELVDRIENGESPDLSALAEVHPERAEELRRTHKCCPRTVLANQLASELLVSLEAMRYRLKQLRLGDE